ncbi:MAG: heavy-metal-associated domain-containing protein, partial [Flavobacterium sp.]|nr:heavy-metal-associated domain-containing protein [Flavobacterium sp.]
TFDSNKTSTEDLSSFINGIAGGNLYTASEIKSKK